MGFGRHPQPPWHGIGRGETCLNPRLGHCNSRGPRSWWELGLLPGKWGHDITLRVPNPSHALMPGQKPNFVLLVQALEAAHTALVFGLKPDRGLIPSPRGRLQT